jgi:probable phosphoglycerate mutase
VATRAELVLIGHGEAVCDVAGLVGGPGTCTGLTARGRRQMYALATALEAQHARAPFDVLYASPRPRTRESAVILGTQLGLHPLVLDDLRGVEYGEADGRARTDVEEAFGGSPQRYPDRPYALGAEPWTSYLQRAVRTLSRLLVEHDGQRVLVAGHAGTIVAANTLLLGLPGGPGSRTGFVVDHASLTWWLQQVDRFGHVTWMLVRHNDTGHLR